MYAALNFHIIICIYALYAFSKYQNAILCLFWILKYSIAVLLHFYYKRFEWTHFQAFLYWGCLQCLLLWSSIAILPHDAHFVVKSVFFIFFWIYPQRFTRQISEILFVELLYLGTEAEKVVPKIQIPLVGNIVETKCKEQLRNFMRDYNSIKDSNLCNPKKIEAFNKFFEVPNVNMNDIRNIALANIADIMANNAFVAPLANVANAFGFPVPDAFGFPVAVPVPVPAAENHNAGPDAVVAEGWLPIRELRKVQVPNLYEALEPMPTVSFDIFNLTEPITCGICQSDLVAGQRVASLSCFKTHIYHKKCIMSWWRVRTTCECVVCKLEINYKYPKRQKQQ